MNAAGSTCPDACKTVELLLCYGADIHATDVEVSTHKHSDAQYTYSLCDNYLAA